MKIKKLSRVNYKEKKKESSSVPVSVTLLLPFSFSKNLTWDIVRKKHFRSQCDRKPQTLRIYALKAERISSVVTCSRDQSCLCCLSTLDSDWSEEKGLLSQRQFRLVYSVRLSKVSKSNEWLIFRSRKLTMMSLGQLRSKAYYVSTVTTSDTIRQKGHIRSLYAICW